MIIVSFTFSSCLDDQPLISQPFLMITMWCYLFLTYSCSIVFSRIFIILIFFLASFPLLIINLWTIIVLINSGLSLNLCHMRFEFFELHTYYLLMCVAQKRSHDQYIYITFDYVHIASPKCWIWSLVIFS